jgi:hypothetical protein
VDGPTLGTSVPCSVVARFEAVDVDSMEVDATETEELELVELALELPDDLSLLPEELNSVDIDAVEALVSVESLSLDGPWLGGAVTGTVVVSTLVELALALLFTVVCVDVVAVGGPELGSTLEVDAHVALVVPFVVIKLLVAKLTGNEDVEEARAELDTTLEMVD